MKKNKSTQSKPCFGFGIHERIMISGLVPTNTYDAVIKGEALIEKLKLTPKEITEFQVKQDPGTTQIKWNEKGAAYLKPVELTAEDKEVLQEVYKIMNEKKIFHMDFRVNYEKIVLGK